MRVYTASHSVVPNVSNLCNHINVCTKNLSNVLYFWTSFWCTHFHITRVSRNSIEKCAIKINLNIICCWEYLYTIIGFIYSADFNEEIFFRSGGLYLYFNYYMENGWIYKINWFLFRYIFEVSPEIILTICGGMEIFKHIFIG